MIDNELETTDNRTPVAKRCNDQPEGDSAQEIPLILVVLNS